jgi:hypothetical protein
MAEPAKIQQAKLESAAPASASDSSPKATSSAGVSSISAPPPASFSPTPAAAANSNPVPDKPAPLPQAQSANHPGVQAEESGIQNAVTISQTYFEVGKFKDPSQAHSASDQLAQLGFPASAVQKNILWKSSYRVLVGPYGDEEKAKETHQDLVSHGYKPRPLEKGSRDFSLRSAVTSGGEHMPVGDCTIRWESSFNDAVVKFVSGNSVVATADGKWVKRDAKYEHDAYVYRRNPDGSRTLLEIHFGGMRRALVFGKS